MMEVCMLLVVWIILSIAWLHRLRCVGLGYVTGLCGSLLNIQDIRERGKTRSIQDTEA